MQQQQLSLAVGQIAALLLSTCISLCTPTATHADGSDSFRGALYQPTEFAFVETPLAEILQTLSTKHGVSIAIDEKALRDAGVKIDSPMTIQVKDRRLHGGLMLLLRPLKLVAIPTQKGLTVTTLQKFASQHVKRTYKIAAHIKRGGALGPRHLEDLIYHLVAPWSWDPVGGQGDITLPGRTMAVNQTPLVHQQIRTLLDDILTVQKTGHMPRTAKEKVLREALAKPISVSFTRTPLPEVVATLKKHAGIEISVVDSAGVDIESRVTLKVSKVSLEAALESLLEPLKLDWIVLEDRLLITTQQAAGNLMQIRFYEAKPFLAASGSMDALIREIFTKVNPLSWDESGGPASMKQYGTLLGVAQNQRNHRAIETLLSEQRKKKQ
jgi:hypothetical protein